MPPLVRQTTTLSRLILGRYRIRYQIYIDLIKINQLIVNILTKTAIHAGNENTILVILLEQIARAAGHIFKQNILDLSVSLL